MKHIFYVHSNILKICCYQIIRECLERKEKVVIITTRGCTWPFFEGQVEVHDFGKIFQGEDKRRAALHNLKALKDYIRYRKYRHHLNNVVKSIVAGEEFYFYLPSMAIDMTAAFANYKYCKGYYYVDEGFLAYTPDDTLKLYVPDAKRNIVKSLLGLKDYYHYELSSKFKGTISITNDSFAWNVDKPKIVNNVSDYVAEVKNDIPYFSDVILTEYLWQDYEIIKQCIDYTVGEILKNRPASKIGLKIHPQAIAYNHDTTSKVIRYVEEKYTGKVTLIPIDVAIEVMSLVYHPILYSLLELSSIIMYALLFKSSVTKIIDLTNDAVSLREVSTIQEYNEEHLLQIQAHCHGKGL